MSTLSLKPWIEVVSLHPDVLSENFSEAIFALDLGLLAEGNVSVPAGDQVEILRRSVRYLLAIDQVKTRAKQHNLTDEQKGQLPKGDFWLFQRCCSSNRS